jgi:hypothetical protein
MCSILSQVNILVVENLRWHREGIARGAGIARDFAQFVRDENAKFERESHESERDLPE